MKRTVIVKTISFVMVTATLVLVAGCKIAVMVPAGGKVISSSETRGCDGGEGGKFCTFDISHQSLPFNESFTAIANPGWQFIGWQQGDRFICTEPANPTCKVSISDTEHGTRILGLFKTGYVMPLFKDVGIDTDRDGFRNELDDDDDNDGLLDSDDPCPQNPALSCTVETIVKDGKIWLQPDLFSNVTREDIAAVCPDGLCAGSLNGQDLTGWTWATSSEVYALLSSYGSWNGSIEHCPSFDNLFYDGWRRTNSTFFAGVAALFGFTSDGDGIAFVSNDSNFPCHRYTGSEILPTSFDPSGAWFYRAQ